MSLLRCEPARNFFIGVPAYQHELSTETAISLTETISSLRKAGMPVAQSFVGGSCYIDDARNQLVQDFLESEYSDLLFVDSDVGFNAKTIVGLALARRPLVGALYPKKEEGRIEFPVRFLDGIRRVDKEGLLEVEFAPSGCLRINRGVFDTMPVKKYKTLSGGGRIVPAYFQNVIEDTYIGEDVWFCREWRRAGGKVHIMPDATLTHSGRKVWTGNFADALRQGVKVRNVA